MSEKLPSSTDKNQIEQNTLPVIDDAYAVALARGDRTPKYKESIEATKARLMEVVAELDRVSLPEDSKVLANILAAIRHRTSAPIMDLEHERTTKLIQDNKREPGQGPLTLEEGAILSPAEREELENVLLKIRRHGWELYKKARLEEKDGSDPETPPSGPIGKRMLEYLTAMHDFEEPEDRNRRMELLVEACKIIVDSPTVNDNIPYHSFAHYAKNIRSSAMSWVDREKWEEGSKVVNAVIARQNEPGFS